MTPARTPRTLASVLLAGALLAVPAPASAAMASGSACAGVRVVVAPPSGPEAVGCARSDGSRSAAEVFEAVGHRLQRVERFPGAVCRVDGEPRDDACVAMPAADASWGFFDTVDGEWHYATAGVDTVRPARGNAVALAWQDDATPRPPATAPGGDQAGSAAGPAEADERSASSGEPDGLPAWTPYALLVALAVAGGAVVLRRRS